MTLPSLPRPSDDRHGDRSASPADHRHHFVDIHPVIRDDRKQPSIGPVKYRGGGERRQLPPPHKSLGRQVSLETGVAVLNMEAKDPKSGSSSISNDKERRALFRSGKSLGGGLGGDGGSGGSVRKGDFNMFRTKSALSKQNSLLPRKESELDLQSMEGVAGNGLVEGVVQNVPAGRYFAALRGPELDQVKDSEDILLPKDEVWPFLLRFPINCFGICLGLGSQAILWGALSSSPAMSFLHVTPAVNLALWLLALAVLLAVSATYALKCAFYFEAVRREYFHPVRVNFFFAPSIACMFLAIATPPSLATSPHPHPLIFCALIAPVFLLELKIYGQWLSGGKRRLCKVANPSSHLSVVGNFVGAVLAAKVGWAEAGKFLWAVGLAHYLVVFVTLYQRLPTNEALPKELHPVYSMFIATPSAASIAWAALHGGDFDSVSRTFYFIALFLYVSLVVRINFFRGFKFSVAWWSYTFPMTTASLAAIKYAEEVPCFTSKGLALSLSLMSSTMVSLLFVSTLLHAFVWKSLFPNDLAIAITKKRGGGGGERSKRQLGGNKGCDLKQWAKKSPLAIVSSITKNNTGEKDSDTK